ncbi:unnamed protein product [Zymoseptoria tritici ST99CH_3D1]|nr:unnamed protein product [Zymoseptoria tritici ST99CH_3D1]
MARIFAEEDIESLIRHFPPLTLEKNDRPCLVTSHSGNNLVSLAQTLSRFEVLLGQQHDRIDKADLANLLGIEQGSEQLILGETSVFIYLSGDGRSIIPIPLADEIHEELKDRARKSFVNVHAFAAEFDIRSEGIQRWITFDASKKWRTFTVDDKAFLCYRSFNDSIESRIRKSIDTAGSDICDLTDVFDDEVQTPILRDLAEASTKGREGDIFSEQGHVVWIPTDYSNVVEERAKTAQLAHIQQMASDLEESHYCMIEARTSSSSSPGSTIEPGLEVLEQEVRKVFQRWHHDSAQLHTVMLNNDRNKPSRSSNATRSRILVDSVVLEHELKELKASAVASTEVQFRRGESSDYAGMVIDQLLKECEGSKPLLSLLLRSELAQEIHLAAEMELERLMSLEREKLAQMFEARLVLPFQLYTIGISTIKDPTLKQHLEDFLYEHFRREVVPQTIKGAQDQKALREKSSQREVEKLRQAIVDAKSFTALQSSISKFSKKIKIPSPSDEVLHTAKVRSLHQALKSMRQMTRGSDVLQNLIWMLLAEKSNGLYMSSGKDTTRMIKQYEAAGEAAMTANLVKWRDLLKTGQESADDLQDMRMAAKAAVDGVTPAQ